MKPYYQAKLGNLWVDKCWPVTSVVTLSKDRNNHPLGQDEVNWLKENVGGIQIIKIIITEEEM